MPRLGTSARAQTATLQQALSLVLASLAASCGPQPVPPPGPPPSLDSLFPPPVTTAEDPAPHAEIPQDLQPIEPLSPPPREAPCAADSDCGYDPRSGRCGADPRWNKQPPVLDQGLICYCDPARSCALLRVDPVPCEGEESCAVRLDPRPHPARATPEHPYRKPRRCAPPRASDRREEDLYTTCERTNICTLHRRECASPRAP